ncbi:MAG: hypothetical protein SVY53_08180 [Chloroflexota bacterium]|nr:hypothetical protein [Chloroflexota bacterium]
MRDDSLDREGWKVASISGGEHLKRILAMYAELGVDTFIEEISPDECSGCTECYTKGKETIYRIYTRQKRDDETA